MNWRTTDNSGQIPEEGDYVAYNCSGQIATGYVRHVGRSKSGLITGNSYVIHQVLPREGHISRVRGGARCLLVLQKNEEKAETQTIPEAQEISS